MVKPKFHNLVSRRKQRSWVVVVNISRQTNPISALLRRQFCAWVWFVGIFLWILSQRSCRELRRFSWFCWKFLQAWRLAVESFCGDGSLPMIEPSGDNWYGNPATPARPRVVFTRWLQYFLSELKTLSKRPRPSLKNISTVVVWFFRSKLAYSKNWFLSAFCEVAPRVSLGLGDLGFRLGFLYPWKNRLVDFEQHHVVSLLPWKRNIVHFEQDYICTIYLSCSSNKKIGCCHYCHAKERKTICFEAALPEANYVRLFSCSFYNSWHNLKKQEFTYRKKISTEKD